MFDILIKNPTIIDGSGEKMFQADIGIKKDRIKKIGNLKRARAKKIIEAFGLYLSPGFIDIHNHSDSYWTLFTLPDCQSLIRQGITSIIGGNCGSSLAPLVEGSIIGSIQKWADINQVNVNWLTVKELFQDLEKRKIGINFGTLVGHATLRRGLLKDEVRPIKKEEIKIMEKMLRQAMKQGAFGLSTGLIFSHAKLASTEEIIKLAKIVKEEGGIYTSHIRGEGKELLPAIKEAIEIGQSSGISVQISHLKALGKKNWPKMEEAIKMIEQAGDKGIDINFDVYPYTTTGSVLYTVLPDWVAEGGKEAMLKRLKKPIIRAKVIEEMKEDEYDYTKIKIGQDKLTDIASRLDKDIEEAVIDLLIAKDGHVIAFMNLLSEENVIKALKHPLAIIGSDGFAASKRTPYPIHPRCFGTFPRVFKKYVRQKKILSWQEAIHKMTGKPASKLGLKTRGLIKKDYFADVCLFRPKIIGDKASFANPYRYSKGMEYVILNGQVIIDKGEYTDKLVGRILKKNED